MILLDVIFQFDPSPFVFLFALCNVLAEIMQVRSLSLCARRR